MLGDVLYCILFNDEVMVKNSSAILVTLNHQEITRNHFFIRNLDRSLEAS
jgi:hypothetical protein